MNILICGVGALGSNIASLLACDLKGEHEITVLDMDKVEERNVQAGTQFYQKDQVGLGKVEALQYNIYKWYEKEIQIIPKELKDDQISIIPQERLLSPFDLIIDCLDNHEGRLLLWKFDAHCSGNHPVLHVGFSDQFTFAVEWSDNYQVPTDIESEFDICEATGAASFVKMVSAIASLTILDYIRLHSKREFVGGKTYVREIK